MRSGGPSFSILLAAGASRSSACELSLSSAERSGRPPTWASGRNRGVISQLRRRGRRGRPPPRGPRRQPPRPPTGAGGEGRGAVGFLADTAGELGRAAADVEDEQLAGTPPEPPAHGEEGEAGLLLA